MKDEITVLYIMFALNATSIKSMCGEDIVTGSSCLT